jgi:hypothetical protein
MFIKCSSRARPPARRTRFNASRGAILSCVRRILKEIRVQRRHSGFALAILALCTLAAAPPDDAGRQQEADRDALRRLIRDATTRATTPEARSASPTLRQWLDAHRGALSNLRPSPLAEQPWGLAALRPRTDDSPAALHLFVFDWHKSGDLVVYGLTGGVRHAYLASDPQTNLAVERRGAAMVIAVPKDAPDALATVVVLELEGKLETTSIAVRPAADGRIVLHARDAVVHGRTLRYEPQPNKNTVGYWTDPADWVSWQFDVTKPGAYSVTILQGCGKGSGGSTVAFSVDEKQSLSVTVQDTGHFQNFVAREIGQFRFDQPGTYTLSVKPTHKPGLAVMDLREVTLTPVAPPGAPTAQGR